MSFTCVPFLHCLAHADLTRSSGYGYCCKGCEVQGLRDGSVSCHGPRLSHMCRNASYISVMSLVGLWCCSGLSVLGSLINTAALLIGILHHTHSALLHISCCVAYISVPAAAVAATSNVCRHNWLWCTHCGSHPSTSFFPYVCCCE
jgi:hypothetical protein